MSKDCNFVTGPFKPSIVRKSSIEVIIYKQHPTWLLGQQPPFLIT